MRLERRRFLGLALGLPAAAVGLPALAPLTARPARAASARWFATGGVAMNGYDPVSYYSEAGPASGRFEEALLWEGASWWFVSARNREAFEMNPEAYAPRYGGYCAYNVSQYRLRESDPLAWTLHEGALYLSSSPLSRERWQRDLRGNIRRADANWPQLLG